MTQKILRDTFIGALLAFAAGAAYGQDNTTIATIPFAFRAAGSDLPAGRYRVNPQTRTMQLQNMDTGKSVYIQARAPITESKVERPRLIFQCGGEEGCSLARLWSGAGSGLEFRTPALTPTQRERRETIYIDRFKEK